MAGFTPKKIKHISLGISIVIHLLLLILPSCRQHIRIEDTPSIYNIPVELSVIKKEILPKSEPKKKPAPQIVKKKTSKKRVAQKKKKAPEKPKTPQTQPGDSDSPLIQSSQDPISPKIAINNEWSGTIEVEATISPEGQLISYTITDSTGHDELDEAFIRTLESSYTFMPRQIFGKKQTGTLRISYTFEL